MPGTLLAQKSQFSARDQPEGSAGGYVLHTGTNLVVVDVVVHGRDGRSVHNLNPADFSLTENGAPQRIRNVVEHKKAAPTADSSGNVELPPGLFTNFTLKTSSAPANILLLDMLNTSLRDQSYARTQISEYLDHAPAGSEMAIVGLSNTLTMLQGFTSNPAILKAVLLHKNGIKGSSLLNDPLGGVDSNATAVSDGLSQLGNTPDVLEAVANAQQFEAESQSFQLQLRAKMTLDSLNELARYLANIPGRKNVLWFSGSFPLAVLGDPSVKNGFATMGSSEEEFRQTANLLAHGEISLYPIDVRGVMNSNVFNAASSNSRYVRDTSAPGKDIAKFDMQTAQENGTMLEAAEDTGGRAFLNTNALGDAVAAAIDDGSNYYTLTYSSTDKRMDGSYRRLVVAVTDKNDTLEYRRGYYADNTKNVSDSVAGNETASAAGNSPISRSMLRGAPASTEIVFRMRMRPITGSVETKAAAGNDLNTKDPRSAGPFIRLAIDLVLDPHDFSMTPNGIVWTDAIQFVTFVYDSDGNLINRAGSIVHTDFNSSSLVQFMSKPFAFSQDISVPVKGNYFIRVAVQDLNSDRIGTIEVPVDSVKSLESLMKENVVSRP